MSSRTSAKKRRSGPTPRRSPPPVTATPRSRRRWWVRGAVLALVIVILIVATDGLRLWRGVDRVDLSLPGAGGGATNYLLVGSDSRAFVSSGADRDAFGSADTVTGQRADLMMLVHVPESGPPVILGIPRDLVVDFAGAGEHRLTTALSHGPQVLVDAYCESLGLGLDHLVVIDFDGFRNLVDLVGGIDLEIARPLRDTATGLDVEAGRQHLDGSDALSLVRSRHAEELVDGTWRSQPEGSKGRSERGQAVLGALAPAVEDRSRSWSGMHALLAATSGSVTVDSAAGRGDAERLGQALGGARSTGPDGGTNQLPAIITEEPVPLARLAPGAGAVLDRVGSGTNPSCARPNVA